jgi:RNA polymerase sigma factor (sigma-70 family)
MTPVLAPRVRPDRSFERLYRRYVGDVYRYALAVMRNEADAEDVTQTTFMNAYRAFQRGERPEKPQNWLIAIAHNVCRQRFRQSARRPSEVSFDDDIADRLVDDDDTPTGEDIRRALGHLAFNQRAALVMRELEGRSYAEIAEILDLSTSAVETLIFRARRALREQLETALTCGEAELAISRQLDGRLSRNEKGALRAHLRQCTECSSFARRQRAQRSALRSLAAVPLPASLSSLFGGGSTAVGTALATKAAVGITVAALVGGGTYGSFVVGSIGPLLLLAVAAGWRYRDRAVGGVLFAAAAAAKLFLWPLLVWLLVTRRLRGAAAAAATIAAILALWALLDLNGLREYPTTLHVLHHLHQGTSYSVEALALSAGASAGAAHLVAVLVALAGIAGIVVVRNDDRAALTLAVVVALLATPILWMHYLILLVVPIALARPTLTPLWALPAALWLSSRPEANGAIWRILIALLVVAGTTFFALRRPSARAAVAPAVA